jgi:hypothetical protein
MTAPVGPDLMPRDAEPTLSTVLRRAAGRWSDGQAAVVCATGLITTTCIFLFASDWWRLSLATLSIASFGAWIIVERSTRRGRLTSLLQGLSAFVGVAAAFGLGLSLLTRILGIWIS